MAILCPSQTCVFRHQINTKQVSSTSASSTESKNRSTSCSSFPLQLKILGVSTSSLSTSLYFIALHSISNCQIPLHFHIVNFIVSLLPSLLASNQHGRRASLPLGRQRRRPPNASEKLSLAFAGGISTKTIIGILWNIHRPI